MVFRRHIWKRLDLDNSQLQLQISKLCFVVHHVLFPMFRRIESVSDVLLEEEVDLQLVSFPFEKQDLLCSFLGFGDRDIMEMLARD